jgi:hypothetical protein
MPKLQRDLACLGAPPRKPIKPTQLCCANGDCRMCSPGPTARHDPFTTRVVSRDVAPRTAHPVDHGVISGQPGPAIMPKPRWTRETFLAQPSAFLCTLDGCPHNHLSGRAFAGGFLREGQAFAHACQHAVDDDPDLSFVSSTGAQPLWTEMLACVSTSHPPTNQ